MQQGHRYGTDEVPPIPQTGEGAAYAQSADLPQYGAPQIQPEAAPQPQAQSQPQTGEGAQVYGQIAVGQAQPPYFAPHNAPPVPPRLYYAAPYAPGGPMMMQQQSYMMGGVAGGSASVAVGIPIGAQYAQPSASIYNGAPMAPMAGGAAATHAASANLPPPAYVAPPPGYSVQAVPIGAPMGVRPPMGVPAGWGGMPMAGAAMGVPMRYHAPDVGQPGHLQPGFWSDRAIDCTGDCGGCCCAVWCPAYRWASTLTRSTLTASFPASFCVYFVPWVLTIVMYILSGSVGYALWVAILAHVTLVSLACTMRGRLRQKYRIAGDSCEDCVLVCCCSCCTIAQEGRHVDRDLGLIPLVDVMFRT